MKFIVAMLVAIGAALVYSVPAMATENEKITICHVAGLASDPANYITLTISVNAVYGPGGHFNENGTPQAGHEEDSFGACNPPPPVDVCTNLEGNQSEVPEGYHAAEDENGRPICIEDEEPPVDVCPNLEGNQETVPPGYGLVDGECVELDITPFCAPPAVLVDGVCVLPPTPPFVGVSEASVFCDLGAQLYRVSGTVDGQAADSADPATIPGNTRGFTNITLRRGDTFFRTFVFTYGDCSTAPPVVTVTTPVTPTVVTTPSPTVTPKPTVKPKPKPVKPSRSRKTGRIR
jgi:hypothetical protein